MRIVAYAACGLLTGAAFFSSACFCAQPSSPDGAYMLSRYDGDALDRDVTVEVDVPRVRETFTRQGRRYVIEYRALSETEYGIGGVTPRSTKIIESQ